MRVVLAARRAARLDAVADDVTGGGGEARVVPTDVGDEAAVRALIDGTVAAWGRLDVLVNNAGIGMLATVEQTTPGGVRADRPRQLPRRRARRAGRAPAHAAPGRRPHRERRLGGREAREPVSRRLRRVEVRAGRLLGGAPDGGSCGSGIHVTCVCPIGTATEFHEVEPNRLGVPGRGGPIQSAAHVARGSCGRSGGRAPRCIRIRRRASCSSRTPSRRPSSTACWSASARAPARADRRHAPAGLVEQEVVDDLQHAAQDERRRRATPPA